MANDCSTHIAKCWLLSFDRETEQQEMRANDNWMAFWMLTVRRHGQYRPLLHHQLHRRSVDHCRDEGNDRGRKPLSMDRERVIDGERKTCYGCRLQRLYRLL